MHRSNDFTAEIKLILLLSLSFPVLAFQSCSLSEGEASIGDPFEGVPGVALGEMIDITDEQAADTGEFFFTRFSDMAIGSNGGIYVGHSGPNTIYHFAADGSYRGTIGSEGKGPGEFQTGPRLAVVGDTLFALDTRAMRVNRFTRQDEEWIFADAFLPDQKEGYSLRSIHLLGRNRLLVEYAPDIGTVMNMADRELQPTRLLELRSPSGGVTDESWLTIPDQDQFAFSPGGGVSMSQTLPYGARSLVDIGPDNRLYHLLTSDFLIRIFDAGGTAVDSVVYPSLRSEISDELRQAEVENMGAYLSDPNTQRAMEQQFYEAIPSFGPALSDMQTDRETGHIIVRRPVMEGAPNWMLLDRGGNRLGVFSLDEEMNVSDFRHGKIVGSVRKEDMLPTVRVVTIRLHGPEI